MKIIITIVCSIFLCCKSTFLFAHHGGHYHKGDFLNTWHLKTGQTIRGNFSMGRGSDIILEQYAGKLVSVPMQLLVEKDQELAMFEINKFKRINHAVAAPAPVINQEAGKGPEPPYSLIIYLLVFFLLLALTNEFLIYKMNRLYMFGIRGIAMPFAAILIFIAACKKSKVDQPPVNGIPKTSVTFIDSAFAPYKPAVATSWDNTYFYIASNGLPSHNMMVGITSWQQQVPIPQFYTGTNKWSVPLQPEYATTPISTKTNFMKGAVAIAVNGVPIFNALNNRGEDAYLIGELDQWGGHCGRADDYHYHAAPLQLSGTSGLMPIAFALDGFAVYGDKEPDGSPITSLDTCHGHTGGNGVYHYHGTNTYPYVIGAMRGKVTIDPNTPAPENQILPQAFASPLRPATSPLSGATITAFASTGTNAYLLTYRRGTKFGSVRYSWDITNKYTFIFTDTSGAVTTAVYQR